MNWLLLGSLLPTALVACLSIYLIRHYAPRLGLIDQPGHRKVHTAPVPLGGGIGIWLGVIVPLVIGQLCLWLTHVTPTGATLLGISLPEVVAVHAGGLREQSGDLWVLLAAGTLLMLLGLVDDRRGLDWKLRIGVQLLIATGLVVGGWRLSFFVDNVWLTGAVSVFWIVGLINAFNMLDNMDALSGGVAAIAASLLAAVLLIAPDPVARGPQLFVAGFLLVLVGSLLGFLWHNRPPAKIFMGDSGSYFIGFWIAIGTTMATFAGENLPRHTILAPLCVLAVPLYDTLTVVLIRLSSGKSPFEGDKNHFSHRLTDLGLSKTQAVLTIYLTTATTGLAALLLYQVNLLGAVVILLMVACVLLLIAILELSARRKLRER